MAVMNSKLNSAAYRVAEVSALLPQGTWSTLAIAGLISSFDGSKARNRYRWRHSGRPLRAEVEPILADAGKIGFESCDEYFLRTTGFTIEELGTAACKRRGQSLYRVYAWEDLFGCNLQIECTSQGGGPPPPAGTSILSVLNG